jgi:ribosomal protein S18 acetylase RimI-like enzyme
MEKKFVIIRELEPKDISKVLKLLNQCDLCGPSDTIAAYRRKMKSDKDLMLVAMDNKRLVGFVMAHYDGWISMLWHLAVSPSYRRRKVATMLTREILRRLQKKGLKRVYALVETRNGTSMAFFRKQGFITLTKVNCVKFSLD